ncbi:unnamed protein product, partial [Prorocentrum cordatum]
ASGSQRARSRKNPPPRPAEGSSPPCPGPPHAAWLRAASARRTAARPRRRRRQERPRAEGEAQRQGPPSPSSSDAGSRRAAERPGGRSTALAVPQRPPSPRSVSPLSSSTTPRASPSPAGRPERSRSPRRALRAGTSDKMRQVYVGCVKAGTTQDDVRAAFEAHFAQLRYYRNKYRGLPSPVLEVGNLRSMGGTRDSKYLFVEFADPVLARTAVAMSGLRICGSSVQVNWTSAYIDTGEVEVLDVKSLRLAGKLPWVGGPGKQMMSTVWALTSKATPMEACQAIRSTLLSLPSVRLQYPDLDEPVLSVQTDRDGKHTFVNLAHERLASTLVAIKQVPVASGRIVKLDWPNNHLADAAHRAPPALELPPDLLKNARADPSFFSAVVDEARDEADFEHRASCEVALSGVRGLDGPAVWGAVADLFRAVPAYREKYDPEGGGPIVNLRTDSSSIAIVRLQDEVLASTAVALESLFILGRRVTISRPLTYQLPAGGSPEPLSLCAGVGFPSWGPSTAEQAPRHPFLSEANRQQAPDLATQHVAVESRPDSVWIGGLEPWGPDRATAEAALESLVTEVAMQLPGFDVEEGPPVLEVRLHPHGKFAFVDLRDASLASSLVQKLRGTWYRGRQLGVELSKRGRKGSDGKCAAKPRIDRNRLVG